MMKPVTIAIALAVLLLLGFGLWAGGVFGAPVKSDREQIIELTNELADAYNSEDWPAFTSNMFSEESNADLVDRFSGYQRFSAIATPPEIVNLDIGDDFAEITLTVRGRVPMQVWSQTGMIRFEKRGGRWWIDADRSFQGFTKP